VAEVISLMATTLQRSFKNISLFFISQVIVSLLNFFFVMLTARYLGPGDYGILTFSIAFTGIFGIISELGLRKVTTREVARNKYLAKEYFGNVAFIKMFLCILTFLITTLFINILGYPENTIRVVYIVAGSVFFKSYSQIIYSIFQAYETIEYESIGHLINSFILFLGSIIIIHFDFKLISFAYHYLFVSCIIQIYCIICYLKQFKVIEIKIDLQLCKSAIKESIPFAIISVFEIIYHWMDTIMLSVIKGNMVVGYYNAAYRIVFITLFIPSAVNLAIYPVMSRYYFSARNNYKIIFLKYLKYMSIIGIFIGCCITLHADKIILLIFGNDYHASIGVLKILIWSSVLIYINGAFVLLFQSSNKQKTITKAAGIAAFANCILNIILIPKYSYIGASIATVLSELIIFILMIYSTPKAEFELSITLISSQINKAVFSGCIILVTGYFLQPFNFITTLLSLLLVYFISIYICGGLDKDDIVIAKRLFYDA
jgi:O-antigen/teichoic acid export membrane protein